MRVRGVVLIIAILAVLAGTWAWQQAVMRDTVRIDSTTPTTAMYQLTRLRVSELGPRGGYDRASFAWREDLDRNGCDTRNDVLRRDLTTVQIRPGTGGCVVESGELKSPYSTAVVCFRRADSSIDIDHVVALSDAWRSGAASWEPARRRQFANDPLNLLAVESSLNQEKGDRNAADWLPSPRGQRCGYVARQVAVKHAYQLTVTNDERRAMVAALSHCPGLPAVNLASVGWPPPRPGP